MDVGKRILIACAALSIALAGCGGDRARINARPLPASTVFDPAELVDVLDPDTIPALDHPAFQTVEKASEWLDEQQPVLVVAIGADTRAYPLLVLTWHEIVNDVVGGRPVAVSYSPLCNTAIVFDRTVGSRAESFGVSGKLYRSNLIMFDRRTHSLWTQLGGRAVRGPLEGAALTGVPSQIASFETFSTAYPNGQVLSFETGFRRQYGFNPYAGYDSRSAPFSFFAVRLDPRLPAMERVVGVTIGDETRAFPYANLSASGGVLSDRLNGQDIVVLWRGGTRSVLDTQVLARGRDIGSAGVFAPIAGGRRLELVPDPHGFRDRQTGSTWSILGVATAGPLAGTRLAPIEHLDAFWFAWAAFAPSSTLVGV